MPSVGLGTYLALGEKLQSVLDYALSVGIRHIDTALSYKNESDIGQVISDNVSQGKFKREHLFVTTKIPAVYIGPNDVRHSIETSLDQLNMSYVDMLLIHHPWGRRNHGDGNILPLNDKGQIDHCHHDLVVTWQIMEALVDEGLTKSIGLSNFTPSQIQRIWDKSRIKPANLQLECHVYLQQNVLRQFCRSKGIAVTGYAPLGAPARQKQHRTPKDGAPLRDAVISLIAEKHKRTPAQILLRYLLELGVIPLPKSETPHRIKENFALFDFSLDAEDMKKIGALDRNQKYFQFHRDINHPEYLTTEPF